MKKQPTRPGPLASRLACVLVVLAFILPGSLLTPATVQAQLAPTATTQLDSELFADFPSGTCEDTSDYIIRTRPVTINFDALGGVVTGPSQTGDLTGQIVGLNLFPSGGISLTAVLDEVQSNASGYTWVGHVDQSPYSEVFLAVVSSSGQLMGSIFTLDGVYSVNPSPDGVSHCVAEVDPAALDINPDDGVEPPAPLQSSVTSAALAAPDPSLAAADNGSLLDVMVVYSPDAKVEAGGTAAIEAVAQTFVDRSNKANANSGVDHRLWLVHTAEVNYSRLTCPSPPTGNCHSEDVARLTNNGDGFMDDVHTLRNTYHADMVLLIVRNADPYSTNGAAWLATKATAVASRENMAFGLGRLDCAKELCFSHEAGHILGLHHDWYAYAPPAPFPYGHGHSDATAQFRTVMAYPHYCTQIGKNCVRIPFFSNPTIPVKGRPTGVENGKTDCVKGQTTPDPTTCDANESKALNMTDEFAAPYRSSQNVWTGNVSTDWNNAENWTMSEGPAGALTVVKRVPRTIDDVLIPSTLASANFPIINTPATVRNLLIEDGASVTLNGGGLTVYGHWEERGTARFTATGGLVSFQGRLPQTLKLNAASTLLHVQVGGAGSQRVKLLSSLDIDGDLAIRAGATLDAGPDGQTLRIAGSWREEANGFLPGNSHVIFDGTVQTIHEALVQGRIQTIDFHDVTVESGVTTLNQDVSVDNHLTIDPGATANFGARSVTVEGTVVNNGALRQRKDAPATATTEFLLIANRAGNQARYSGVDITAETALGLTTVEVRGNQPSCTGNPTDPLMLRCFIITPTTPGVAQIRFWYTEAERNAQEANKADIYQYGGGLTPIGANTISSEASAACASGGPAGCWVQADNIADYTRPFGLGAAAQRVYLPVMRR